MVNYTRLNGVLVCGAVHPKRSATCVAPPKHQGEHVWANDVDLAKNEPSERDDATYSFNGTRRLNPFAR